MPTGRPLSLKARAIGWLAQREYSRSELARKLSSVAAQTTDGIREGLGSENAESNAREQEIAGLLDWLEAKGYLSEARFTESRVRVRAPRFGTQRIRQELAMQGVALSPAVLESLRSTEYARARAVFERRFGHPASDAPGRARQSRFLAGRGFSADVIRRVLQSRSTDADGRDVGPDGDD